MGPSQDTVLLEKVVKHVGRNAVVGKERFSPTPFFWMIQCEKGDSLMETLELLKAFGLVYVFLDEAYFAYMKMVIGQATR